jgi:hypothetical protein
VPEKRRVKKIAGKVARKGPARLVRSVKARREADNEQSSVAIAECRNRIVEVTGVTLTIFGTERYKPWT